MAWQLPYRPTRLHYAVSAAPLCSMGSAILLPAAMAATIGKTTITQHSMSRLSLLLASLTSNFTDFEANLANPKVYKQLGLTPTDVKAVFIPFC